MEWRIHLVLPQHFSSGKTYVHPDESIIAVAERFRFVEVLCQPTSLTKEPAESTAFRRVARHQSGTLGMDWRIRLVFLQRVLVFRFFLAGEFLRDCISTFVSY